MINKKQENYYRVALAIPTYNANVNHGFSEVLSKIEEHKEILDEIFFYDSQSSDDTLEMIKKYHFQYKIINKDKFSHSGTRTQICKDMMDKDIDYLFFLTQDVILQRNSLKILLDFMKNVECSLAYGKQEVDLEKGNLFEYFARSFNYGDIDLIKSKKDIPEMGIKTIFCSDAFALYDLNKIEKVGFFGSEANFAEDMIIADKLLQHGEKIGYCSNAKVYHTHKYSILEEFKRYEDIGRFHYEFRKILSKYSSPMGEGVKLAIEEVKFLFSRRKILLIPVSLTRNTAKFLGLRNGKLLAKKGK